MYFVTSVDWEMKFEEHRIDVRSSAWQLIVTCLGTGSLLFFRQAQYLSHGKKFPVDCWQARERLMLIRDENDLTCDGRNLEEKGALDEGQ